MPQDAACIYPPGEKWGLIVRSKTKLFLGFQAAKCLHAPGDGPNRVWEMSAETDPPQFLCQTEGGNRAGFRPAETDHQPAHDRWVGPPRAKKRECPNGSAGYSQLIEFLRQSEVGDEYLRFGQAAAFTCPHQPLAVRTEHRKAVELGVEGDSGELFPGGRHHP